MDIAQTTNGPLEYRVESPGSSRTILMLHGGHMNASIRLGEEYFVKKKYRVIAVSRPGYGNTALSTGRNPDNFAVALKDLLGQLKVKRVTVLGISAGGRSAMRFAARYPERVEKLLLQSSVSFEKWPDTITNLTAHTAFNPFMEKYTWSIVRFFLKKNPRACLAFLLGSMSTKNAREIIHALSDQTIADLTDVFRHTRSGKGFLTDIHTWGGTAKNVHVPTLIIHSAYDKSVAPRHAHTLHKQIKNSRIYMTSAESHLIWFSREYTAVENRMTDFLER